MPNENGATGEPQWSKPGSLLDPETTTTCNESKDNTSVTLGQLGTDTQEDTSSSVNIEHEPYLDTEHYYGIRTTPPPLVTVMAALQHILLSISACLTTSQVVADVACAPYDHPLRSQLFCTTLFMVGLCTFMQTALGVRLPIFQGPSSSFLVPLLALQRDSLWACPTEEEYHPVAEYISSNATTSILNSTKSFDVDGDLSEGMVWRLQTMSGSLMLAGLSEVLLGSMGLLKVLLRFVGPITVACTISLIAVSIFKVPLMYGRPSYSITAATTALVVIFILYLKNITLPIPNCGKGNKSKPRKRFPIFQLVPVLLGLVIMWLISGLLTVSNIFTDDKNNPSYMARTDAKLSVIETSPWLQFTYPGQFGSPKLSVALLIGFLVAFFCSMIESVGDYYAAQKACMISRPPDHAISRGILVEGLGSIISGAVGAGHATTSFSANIALLTVSKTTSRAVMYTASFLLICISLFGKIGASLTTIPNPVLAGVLVVLVGTLFSIGMENLNTVDMRSSRNMVVMGLPFMCALIIPTCLEMYPELIDTGIHSLDQVLKVSLGMPMFVGGVLALFLDNTVPGTLESRGMAKPEAATKEDKKLNDAFDDLGVDSGDQDADIYSWPFYSRLIKTCPCLTKLPFMPRGSSRNILRIQ